MPLVERAAERWSRCGEVRRSAGLYLEVPGGMERYAREQHHSSATLEGSALRRSRSARMRRYEQKAAAQTARAFAPSSCSTLGCARMRNKASIGSTSLLRLDLSCRSNRQRRPPVPFQVKQAGLFVRSAFPLHAKRESPCKSSGRSCRNLYRKENEASLEAKPAGVELRRLLWPQLQKALFR